MENEAISIIGGSNPHRTPDKKYFRTSDITTPLWIGREGYHIVRNISEELITRLNLANGNSSEIEKILSKDLEALCQDFNIQDSKTVINQYEYSSEITIGFGLQSRISIFIFNEGEGYFKVIHPKTSTKFETTHVPHYSPGTILFARGKQLSFNGTEADLLSIQTDELKGGGLKYTQIRLISPYVTH